jgi:hypothetical protein
MADFETNPVEETKNPVQKITANGVTKRERERENTKELL